MSSLLIAGIVIAQESLQRHLGIDHHVPPVGEVEDKVGAQHLTALPQHHLSIVLRPSDKALPLQNLLQPLLAPVALHLAARRHRTGEAIGLVAYDIGLLDQHPDLPVELTGAAGIGLTGRLQRKVHLVDARPQRCQH